MFFYNQRAIVFGSSAVVLLGLLAIQTQDPTELLAEVLVVLFLAWSGGAAVTLILHPPFKLKLERWASSPPPRSAPPLFDRYFLLDSTLVFLILGSGYVLHLPLEGFAFLLFANTFLYAAYLRSDYPATRWISYLIFLLPVVALLLLAGSLDRLTFTSWRTNLIYAAPLVGMIFITLFSITMISWLRTEEHGITRKHLGLLGKYEDLLAGPNLGAATGNWERDQDRYSERQFRKQLTLLLKDLCSLPRPFWYSAAGIWLAESHQDRGRVYLLAATYNFEDWVDARDGIEAITGFLETDDLLLVPSLRNERDRNTDKIWRFNLSLDAPAAIVPLRRDEAILGFLVLYGREQGPPAQRQEEAFLRALGSIIGNTMEQWEGRYRAFPQKEMDNLFSCQSLEEVFPKAAEILRTYLFAAGCMLIFRPDPNRPEMTIVAKTGFKAMNAGSYRVGSGLTGRCAESQLPIRIDDVTQHCSEFDQELFRSLEKAHGHRIVSWLAIPIGEIGQRNYGVIKVVNSRFRCPWFTSYDERIGADLALRLHVIIERFLHIRDTEKAREDATANALAAERSNRLLKNSALRDKIAGDSRRRRDAWRRPTARRDVQLRFSRAAGA